VPICRSSQDQVLGGHAEAELALVADPHRLGLGLGEALGGEDVLDLARADAEGSAPNAPWVAVCESPQTMVMPGWVTPSSGPMTWTIPWRSEPIE
jgi:hypothetical protein